MASALRYSGDLITYAGGQTLTGAWKAPAPTAPLGTITIDFFSSTSATITWPGGSVPIQRFDFGPGGSAGTQDSSTPQSGWWWNPSEGGRGFAIEVQGGAIYFAGYMYDSSGKAIWYLASGNMSNPTLYQGAWQQFAGGQTLTGPFKPSTLANANVGSISLQFVSPGAATMTLPDGRQIPFSRFAFGLSAPTLAAVSPAAATPASPFTITGSGIDVTAALSLTIFDSSGYSATIPLVAASATSARAAVPPYVSVATGALASGPVSIKLTQTTATTAVESNTLGGFTIQPLAKVAGTPGQSTLALIIATLREAQRLKASLQSSALGTGAVITAIGQQVADLQALVNNVQSVVQNGIAFSLGTVGGVNITVTQSNIADVDSLILATINALAQPTSGSALKSGEATGGACMSAEAQAYSTAVASGTASTASTAQITQLAQALVAASSTSAACNSTDTFAAAYQIFGGANNLGLGLANGAGGATNPARLPGAALFASATQGTNTAIALNALSSPALAAMTATVQQTIGSVAGFAVPTTSELLTKAGSGPLKTSLIDAQTIIGLVANPFQGTFSGTWSGTCSSGSQEGPGSAGGSFTMTVSTNGTITGSFAGSASGALTGNASTVGTFAAAAGSADVANWGGQLNAGARLSGSGSWTGSGCSGTWAG